jgi:hypothetical protein
MDEVRRSGPSAVRSNWRSLVCELADLHDALEDLPRDRRQLPSWLRTAVSKVSGRRRGGPALAHKLCPRARARWPPKASRPGLRLLGKEAARLLRRIERESRRAALSGGLVVAGSVEVRKLCEQVDELLVIADEVVRAVVDEQDAPGQLFVDGDQGDRDMRSRRLLRASYGPRGLRRAKGGPPCGIRPELERLLWALEDLVPIASEEPSLRCAPARAPALRLGSPEPSECAAEPTLRQSSSSTRGYPRAHARWDPPETPETKTGGAIAIRSQPGVMPTRKSRIWAVFRRREHRSPKPAPPAIPGSTPTRGRKSPVSKTGDSSRRRQYSI